jgi:hypothetical protein
MMDSPQIMLADESLLDTWGAENRLERLDVYRPKTQLDSRHWKVVESRGGSSTSWNTTGTILENVQS